MFVYIYLCVCVSVNKRGTFEKYIKKSGVAITQCMASVFV